ncbi:hypothetical protein WDU94_000183 [Cyamophila willieti]
MHSDITFIVQGSKLYAWSGLVSVASTTLGSMISTHIAHCDDREICLRNVKNIESFSILLKSMYGLTINFTQTTIAVLCEALNLADEYKLTTFFNDLKSYMSDLDNLTLDTTVLLLNTAYKFRITELYNRVVIYACKNSDDLMKHESFPTLQYSVLVNLIKSNWFFSKEMDILIGILNWHRDMDEESKKSLANDNGKETEEHDGSDFGELSESETDVGEKETSETIEKTDNKTAETIDNETTETTDNKTAETTDNETTETTDNKTAEKTDNGAKDKKVESLSEGKESSSAGFNSKNMKPAMSGKIAKPDKRVNMVPVFSENVLKSLLAHVRISRISAQDWLGGALVTELFKRYEHLLLDVNNFSASQEGRLNYKAVTILTSAGNTSSKFTIEGRLTDTLYESEEEYVLDDYKWKVCCKFSEWLPGKQVLTHKSTVFTMFLKCSPCENPAEEEEEEAFWQCAINCRIKLISPNRNIGNVVMPDDQSYTRLELTNRNFCVEIGKFEWEGIPILSKGISILSTGIPILSIGIPILSTGISIRSTGIPILSPGIPIFSPGIPILSTGIPILSTGIPILSTGIPILSTGIPILNTGIPILSTGIPILSTGIPILSTGIPILSPGIPISLKINAFNEAEINM